MFRKHSLMGSILVISGLLLLAGCATEGNMAMSDPAAEASTPSDTAQMNTEATQKSETADSTKTASLLERILRKMSANRLTLYWKDKDSYTYLVGGVVEAEYKPGDGLTVRDQSLGGLDDALECNYSEDGKLQQDTKLAQTCSGLMFTLDQQLTD